MLNSKPYSVVISSVARNLLGTGIYTIFYFLNFVENKIGCYLPIQEISRYTRNDNQWAVLQFGR